MPPASRAGPVSSPFSCLPERAHADMGIMTSMSTAWHGWLGVAIGLTLMGCGSDSSSPAAGSGSSGASSSGGSSGGAVIEGGADGTSSGVGTGSGSGSTSPDATTDDGSPGTTDAPTGQTDGAVMTSDSGVGNEQWHPIDLTFSGASTTPPTAPFSARFTGPGGQMLTIPGFQIAPGMWKIRFAPTAAGTWTYQTASSADAALNGKTGTIPCVANTNPLVHGRLAVDANNPHHFKYEDGTQYLMMAFEADWLALMDFGDPTIAKAKSLIDIYASHGFNEVLMNVYAHDTTWAPGHTNVYDFGPPAQYAWKGTNSAPDYTQMNAAFFENYDRVIQYLFDHGVVAHIMIKVYNKLVNWPAKGSADDDLFFGYVLARYQAYPNVIWDFAKESSNEPDLAYKTGRIQFIRAHDAYHRLVTTHTDVAYYATGPVQGLLDFRTDQEHTAWYAKVVTRRNTNAWPVFNSEFGYEVGNDGGHTYGSNQDKVTVLRWACEIMMAGGYIGYYYTYHAWDVVRFAEVPNGLPYYKNLFDLFAKSHWYDLTPQDTLIDMPVEGRHCLAKGGSEYLVFLAAGGTVHLNVTGLAAGGSLKGTWVDLVTGMQQPIPAVQANGTVTLTSPWTDPAIAHLGP
jgi:hypothetical protein